MYDDALSVAGQSWVSGRVVHWCLTPPNCLGGVRHQGFKLIKLSVGHMPLGARPFKVALSNLKHQMDQSQKSKERPQVPSAQNGLEPRTETLRFPVS